MDKSDCSRCKFKCWKKGSTNIRDPKKRPVHVNVLFNEISRKVGYERSKGKPKFLLFVEGNADIKFYDKIRKNQKSLKIITINVRGHNPYDKRSKKYDTCDSPNCYFKMNKKMIEFLFCRNNKSIINTNPYNFIKDYFEKFSAIGLVDRDFEGNCNEIQYPKKQFYPLFQTETRDLETLMCKSGGLNCFLEENFDSNRAKEIEKQLKELASIPGYARYLNFNPNKSYIDFSNIKYDFRYNPFPFQRILHENNRMTCKDIANILRKNGKNQGKTKFFNKYAAGCKERLTLFDNDIWSICQGHDTMNILVELFKLNNNNNYNIEPEISEEIQNCFIRNKCYKNSLMIKKVIEWERMYHPDNFKNSNCGEIFKEEVYAQFDS